MKIRIRMLAILSIVSLLLINCGENTSKILDKIDDAIESGDYYSAKKFARDLRGQDKEDALDKISKAEISFLILERNDIVTALELVEEDGRYESYMVAIMKNLDTIEKANGQSKTLSIIAQMPTPNAYNDGDGGERYDTFVKRYNEYLRTYAAAQRSAGKQKYAESLIDLLKPKVNQSLSSSLFGKGSEWDYSEVEEIKKQFQ